MTFKIIAPFVSCVVNEAFETPKDTLSEFDEAINAGYPNIYMITSSGIIYHQSLRPGKAGKQRFIRTAVKEIPGLKLQTITPKVNFLPEGKIPVRLLDEVKAFFKKVIEKRGKAVEAMIWILWDESKGYHLFVPNQVVSHVSVRYDWASVPAGSSIIVDIHSHADFKASFSETDNSDDRGSIRFSGVIGHNNTDTQDTVWRFNHPNGEIEVKITDLFETPPVEQLSVPDAWIDKVQIPAPAPPSQPAKTGGYTKYIRGMYVDEDEPVGGYTSAYFNKPKGVEGASEGYGKFGKLDRGPWGRQATHRGMNYNPGKNAVTSLSDVKVLDNEGIPEQEQLAFEQEEALKKKERKKGGRKTLTLRKGTGQTNG